MTLADPVTEPGAPAYRRQPSATVWSWLIALGPLPMLLPVAAALLEFDGATRGALHESDDRITADMHGHLAQSLALLVVLVAASTALAVLDRRRLRRLGVVRPFHWAFAVVPVVYLTGRAVVLLRRQGSGSLLVAVHLACVVVVVLGTAAEGLAVVLLGMLSLL